MPPVIQTRFDRTLEEDVYLEQSSDSGNIVDTLKNAENTYKAFLYLRKMYSLYTNTETVIKMDSISNDDYVEIDKPENVNSVLITNTGDATCSVKINGDPFDIIPGKDFVFPLVPKDDDNDGDKLELKGTLSYCLKIVQEF